MNGELSKRDNFSSRAKAREVIEREVAVTPFLRYIPPEGCIITKSYRLMAPPRRGYS